MWLIPTWQYFEGNKNSPTHDIALQVRKRSVLARINPARHNLRPLIPWVLPGTIGRFLRRDPITFPNHLPVWKMLFRANFLNVTIFSRKCAFLRFSQQVTKRMSYWPADAFMGPHIQKLASQYLQIMGMVKKVGRKRDWKQGSNSKNASTIDL